MTSVLCVTKWRGNYAWPAVEVIFELVDNNLKFKICELGENKQIIYRCSHNRAHIYTMSTSITTYMLTIC